MKEIAEEIKSAGYVPGIQLSPFTVSRDSEIF